MLDTLEMTRRAGQALLEAYSVARSLPVVVTSRKVGTNDVPAWAFDFEDADSTVVVSFIGNKHLLSKHVSWQVTVDHALAGHRTGLDGLGDASRCTLCAGGPPAGVREQTFTHPEYVAPEPEQAEADAPVEG